eukprot:TRINITY_DN3524_c0_g1_i3.p1 TRINITY_DN3524_c0_g1~~TRINITY_DN3524_c0_g1_i3.p1  ORF type:complete len:310 (+),score=66.39 TRINITY_DN3524_c0_g1_i3:263-1192(+)
MFDLRRKKPKAPLLTQILNEYFPGGYSTSLAEFERDINKPFRPLGNKIHEYTRELGGQRFSYKSYHMVFENPSTRAFFDRLQVNSVWNIENASLIDVESDDNWEAICTYKMHEDGSYELVGYATIYFFYAYPDKSRLRISQVVVFPQHRRQRHASELLKTIYLIGNVRNVVEFTVEDISEEFRIVRAMVDIRNIHDLGFWKTAQELESPSNASQEIQKRLKLHKRQVNECLEILRLGATNVHDQAKYKAYRLSIKRRIYMQQIGSNNRKGVEKEDEEDEENEEKIKQGLHDLYLETEALYRKVLDALDK